MRIDWRIYPYADNLQGDLLFINFNHDGENALNIVQLIAAIDAEIERLARAKQILASTSGTTPSGRRRSKNVAVPIATSQPKRRLSAGARAKIAAAQRARWSKAKKGTRR